MNLCNAANDTEEMIEIAPTMNPEKVALSQSSFICIIVQAYRPFRRDPWADQGAYYSKPARAPRHHSDYA